MIKFVVFVFIIAISLHGVASPVAPATTSPLFVNPYYPEFTQPNEELSRSLMDAGLENEINQYIERRDRLQQLLIEQTDNNAGLLQNNSFVMKRLMDRGTRRVMHSSWVKKSSLGRMADNVKHSLETDIEFQDSKNVKHKLDFKIAAFQGQLFLQYEGVTKAQLRYDVSNGGSVAMIFQHDLSDMSAIGIETTLAGQFQTQSLLLSIAF
jgi:hypothetical protein